MKETSGCTAAAVLVGVTLSCLYSCFYVEARLVVISTTIIPSDIYIYRNIIRCTAVYNIFL